MTNQYISVHLFYGGDLNFLLKKGIEPFIKKHQEKIVIWFFIRYNEDGQHIRLRVYVVESFSETMKVWMTNYFNDFFEKYPSNDADIPYHKYPNNSIQFIDYQREIERYGKETAVDFFFMASSNFVLEYLDESQEYENVLIVALLMNLHLICGFFKRESSINANKKMIETYQKIYDNWLNYTLHYTQFTKNEIEQQFENIYQQQKDILEELIQDILVEYNTQTFDNDEFYHWKTVIVDLCSDSLNTNYDSKKANQILRDLVHLNHNRFGISNFDEPLLAYLTLRVLK